MNQLKNNVQKVFQQAKTKITDLIMDEDTDEANDHPTVSVSVELERDLYSSIRHKAKNERSSEQAIIVHTLKQHFENRAPGRSLHISQQQKENNPLFLLDNMTKTLE